MLRCTYLVLYLEDSSRFNLPSTQVLSLSKVEMLSLWKQSLSLMITTVSFSTRVTIILLMNKLQVWIFKFLDCSFLQRTL